MSSTALTPIRPIRRRSRAASARMKPSTTGTGRNPASPLSFVLQELTPDQGECARSELARDSGLMSGQEDGGALEPDVFHEIEYFGGDLIVQVSRRLVGQGKRRRLHERARQRRAVRFALGPLMGIGVRPPGPAHRYA